VCRDVKVACNVYKRIRWLASAAGTLPLHSSRLFSLKIFQAESMWIAQSWVLGLTRTLAAKRKSCSGFEEIGHGRQYSLQAFGINEVVLRMEEKCYCIFHGSVNTTSKIQ